MKLVRFNGYGGDLTLIYTLVSLLRPLYAESPLGPFAILARILLVHCLKPLVARVCVRSRRQDVDVPVPDPGYLRKQSLDWWLHRYTKVPWANSPVTFRTLKWSFVLSLANMQSGNTYCFAQMRLFKIIVNVNSLTFAVRTNFTRYLKTSLGQERLALGKMYSSEWKLISITPSPPRTMSGV